jgi:hypothetical protein
MMRPGPYDFEIETHLPRALPPLVEVMRAAEALVAHADIQQKTRRARMCTTIFVLYAVILTAGIFVLCH